MRFEFALEAAVSEAFLAAACASCSALSLASFAFSSPCLAATAAADALSASCCAVSAICCAVFVPEDVKTEVIKLLYLLLSVSSVCFPNSTLVVASSIIALFSAAIFFTVGVASSGTVRLGPSTSFTTASALVSFSSVSLVLSIRAPSLVFSSICFCTITAVAAASTALDFCSSAAIDLNSAAFLLATVSASSASFTLSCSALSTSGTSAAFTNTGFLAKFISVIVAILCLIKSTFCAASCCNSVLSLGSAAFWAFDMSLCIFNCSFRTLSFSISVFRFSAAVCCSCVIDKRKLFCNSNLSSAVCLIAISASRRSSCLRVLTSMS